ncbi:MAG: dTDP-4-dehydrorhamnose 3,5-epimerase [Desulfobacteraceae bacterium]|nr:dTDP-4-dehydrorhamnose 3,5-epimerase [Desulfobacteraceae bacterium]
MIFTETTIKGAFTIEVETHGDDRGYFGRLWCRDEFCDHGLNPNVAQANIGYSTGKGTLRGLHYQVNPFEEAKLVRCVRGKIFDVIVDLREDSETCGQWFGAFLEEGVQTMLYAPEGTAHGYLTMTDHAEILYMVSQFYTPQAEAGIRWNDPAFNIEWPQKGNLILSDKDLGWPDFKF